MNSKRRGAAAAVMSAVRRIEGRDVSFMGGVALVAWGAYLVFPPAAAVTVGGILLYLSLRRG